MTPTPETHVFIGMFRRPYSDCEAEQRALCPNGIVYGSSYYEWFCCGDRSEAFNKCKEMWLAGYYDEPVYATRSEIIDRIAEKAHAENRT
jgi:hypothetical protein